MEKNDIYNDLINRTNGEIYIGVVGPIRTGKSTFIIKFMENLVIPNIKDKLEKQIAIDELPQSADGKAVMTTQPKFVPANAVKVNFKNKTSAKVKLIDCVGFFVDGISEDNSLKNRMVKTPWNENEVTFEEAANIGTEKVITDYSSFDVMITTDGSFSNIPREKYETAEEKCVNLLKNNSKPFVIILNCKDPLSNTSKKLANELEEKYNTSVLVKNLLEFNDNDSIDIIEKVLYEFPMRSFNFNLPDWMQALPKESNIIKKLTDTLKTESKKMKHMRNYTSFDSENLQSDFFRKAELKEIKLGEGKCLYDIKEKEDVLFKVLSDECNEKIENNFDLIKYLKEFSSIKQRFNKISKALNDAEESGYGVVYPSTDEMNLSEPQLVKKGGKCGIKLNATASSLHLIKVDVSTEVSPMVGTEKQGEDLISYINDKFENNPKGLWETDFFGKSLHELVSEGLSEKITAIPKDATTKMRKTLTKMVNENRGGMICILL